MDKIDHKSKDILGGNAEKIAELFPGVITEAKDEATGELKKVVDFDLLRQHLSDELVEGDRERFRLDWPGKRASILKANTPITKTLRPVREDSVDFDTTQNIFIEGDNFEVLKVLQESYLGKIKMIYIDPPYNTGKDFIYKDNFAADKGEYEEELGVRDDESGGKLVKIVDTHGRYHSDWLSMMQERLAVARDLLSDDGVVFVSIGDDEQAHLKNICNEIFGENNFIAQMPWIYTGKEVSVDSLDEIPALGTNLGSIKKSHEYVLCYAKSNFDMNLLPSLENKSIDRVTKSGNKISEITFPSGLKNENKQLTKTFYGTIGGSSEPVDILSEEGMIFQNGVLKNDVRLRGCFSVKGFLDELFSGRDVYDKRGNKILDVVISNTGLPRIVKEKNGIVPSTLLSGFGDTSKAEAMLKDLFNDGDFFDYPKPVQLIKRLTSLGSDQDGLILDFFSGSGTTAHAVMQLNAEDGGNRKHMQVQLAEPTDPSSEAYKAGYKTIPEISRERIRRAAKKIREDYAEQIAKRDTPLDTGFRAYKLSSSSFVDTAQHPAQTTQSSLLDTEDNIKDDRTAEDLLTEVILDLGLTLDLPIEHRDIAGNAVFFVGGNSLVACFDDKVTLDIVDGIAAEKPLRVVFKDSSFANDETRINIDIRLKQLSPDTTVQVV